MNLRELYDRESLVLSMELFPPKTDAGVDQLFENLRELVQCQPSFITCTYGAGGSTRDRTLQVLARIRREYPHIPVASHLTCVNATVAELREYVNQALLMGVDYIVALRGDPPKGEACFVASEGGLRYGDELVAMIRQEFPKLGILVGGYPEKHPEALSAESDIGNLKRKVDAGADVIVTQLFYDNEDFYRWRDRCVAAGIDVPIVPGILPITNFAQVQRITALCGAQLPPKLAARLVAQGESEEGQYAAGVYHATRQVEDLIERGQVPGVHFYVLNKSRATAHICRALGLGTPAG